MEHILLKVLTCQSFDTFLHIYQVSQKKLSCPKESNSRFHKIRKSENIKATKPLCSLKVVLCDLSHTSFQNKIVFYEIRIP